MQFSDSYGVAFVENAAARKNPHTGETYRFLINTGINIRKSGKTGAAYIGLDCERGGQATTVLQYNIEVMNCYSLVAFIDQYKLMIWNWTYDCELATLIRTCEQAFSEGPGPVIKINGKYQEPKPGTNIEVVK